ncbi:MAG: aminodeoxychorismate synthase component I [Rhodocyclaceae bacterium]|nr:aminodeoxychorismate synthase component I [Rhodocyclaceae bacterium]
MIAQPTGESFALFEDTLGDAGALLFRGACECLSCLEAEGMDAFFSALESATREGRWAILAADFEAGYWFEPRLAPRVADQGRLRAWIFPSRECLDREQADAFISGRIAQLAEAARVAGIAQVRESLSEQAFARAIGRIRDYIAAGDCYQVNFTYGLDFRTYGHPLALYERLRQTQPVRYGACLALPGLTALSLSPELFLERRGRHLVSRPMKGTARRGASPTEDAALAAGLAASDKDRAENVMIVDLIRNDLGRLARPGSVRVDGLCRVESYPTVFQMVSDVSADIADPSLHDIFRALFPCGSITGAPKLRAMEIIRELEAEPRGLYTGALGWFAPSGDFVCNVAIRTLVLEEGGVGRLGIGAGIVTDSDAASERRECEAKARFLTDLPAPFRLIETLRLESGAAEPYPLLEWHMRRLGASGACFGFRWHEAEVRRRLQACAAGMDSPGSYRVRLLLSWDGAVELASSPLPAGQEGPVGAALAQRRLDSGDLLLRHKTTARGLYDADLASLPAGLFDFLYLNERGELCEGARSNLFLQLNGRLYTPPLACGLLDGVMRRKLLEEGRAEERVLTLEDLNKAEAFYLSNALRGLMPALLAS